MRCLSRAPQWPFSHPEAVIAPGRRASLRLRLRSPLPASLRALPVVAEVAGCLGFTCCCRFAPRAARCCRLRSRVLRLALPAALACLLRWVTCRLLVLPLPLSARGVVWPPVATTPAARVACAVAAPPLPPLLLLLKRRLRPLPSPADPRKPPAACVRVSCCTPPLAVPSAWFSLTTHFQTSSGLLVSACLCFAASPCPAQNPAGRHARRLGAAAAAGHALAAPSSLFPSPPRLLDNELWCACELLPLG
jgi:hypothetical protein